MQRVVWTGFFIGAAFFGSITSSDSKIVRLKCAAEVDSGKLVLNIVADDRKKSVQLEVLALDKDQALQLRQVHEYIDGVYATSLRYEKSKNGSVLEGPGADSKNPPRYQHVLIQKGKIKFGPDNNLVIVDMAAGGAIVGANGKPGFCDYAK